MPLVKGVLLMSVEACFRYHAGERCLGISDTSSESNALCTNCSVCQDLKSGIPAYYTFTCAAQILMMHISSRRAKPKEGEGVGFACITRLICPRQSYRMRRCLSEDCDPSSLKESRGIVEKTLLLATALCDCSVRLSHYLSTSSH